MTAWWLSHLSEQYWSIGMMIPNTWRNKDVPNHQPNMYIYIYIYIFQEALIHNYGTWPSWNSERFPMNSMAIFQFAMLTLTRGQQLFLLVLKSRYLYIYIYTTTIFHSYVSLPNGVCIYIYIYTHQLHQNLNVPINASTVFLVYQKVSMYMYICTYM